jgi:hypothetical protein
MGEPPALIDTHVDGNEHLRRMYYWEAPEEYRQVRLGAAVAASSCVPGLFEPLSFKGLYPDRVVRLVDGGVCDNQGIGGLLEQDCSVVLVSDGSGQTESQRNPSLGWIGVPLRSNSILQARVREAQYRELRARRRSSLLRGLMFVHLKEDLGVSPVDWVDCLDPFEASDDARPPSQRGPLTSYGIEKDVQRLLAAIRTDLDSFSDVEADTLMTSAYRMTDAAFATSPELNRLAARHDPVAWDFLGVERVMRGTDPRSKALKRLLRAGSNVAFKVWRLSRELSTIAGVVALALVIGVGIVVAANPQRVVLPSVTLGTLGWVIVSVVAFAAIAFLYGWATAGAGRLRDVVQRVVLGLAMISLGWLAARIHLHVFDRIFLRLGSSARLERGRDPNANSSGQTAVSSV